VSEANGFNAVWLTAHSLRTRTLSSSSKDPRPPCLRDSNLRNIDSEFSSKELRTVGNYTLGRLIGKGSFGKVYLATHKLTNGSKVGHLPANLEEEFLTPIVTGSTEIRKEGRCELGTGDTSS